MYYNTSTEKQYNLKKGGVMDNLIQRERCRLGLRQTELAQRIGVSKQTVCEWEKGRSFPRKETLIRLASVLNTTTDRLLNRDTEAP